MMMTKLMAFMRRHALWLGMVVVVVPLLLILWLQYRSLAELQRTTPGARREHMRRYVAAVADDTAMFYRETAEQALNVPPDAFNRDPREQIARDRIIEHFARHQTPAARRLFVGFMAARTEAIYAVVFFYNPTTRLLEKAGGTNEWRAAHAASANWIARRMTDTVPENVSLTVDEASLNHRAIVKPIIAPTSGQVIGVAGMLVDEDYFREKVLPDAMQKSLRKFFPDNHQDLLVLVLDSHEQIKLSSRPFVGKLAEGQAYEVGGGLPFIFKDWRLGARMRQFTEDQWARRAFLYNLTLTILMTLLLAGGIALTLRAASRELKLSQMKSDFVSNVSHELRTPLTSIRTLGEFLRLGRVNEPEKMRKYGEYIENESRRLTQLINNILDFSRIESGRKAYQFEPADIIEIVASALSSFDVRLKQGGFNVRLERAPIPLPIVEVDAEALQQAFINLLDNAVKYSGQAREIIVRLGKKDDEVTISVTDSGIGIASEDQGKIFEKFYRVGGTLTHNVKGSGLGLAIVRHIVEAHRGAITVASELGKGSAFTIRLPFAEPAQLRPDARPDSATDENATWRPADA